MWRKEESEEQVNGGETKTNAEDGDPLLEVRYQTRCRFQLLSKTKRRLIVFVYVGILCDDRAGAHDGGAGGPWV
eukprot:SAG11_NODE_8244_length_1041_cov_1.990446_1_plen_74_part_00